MTPAAASTLPTAGFARALHQEGHLRSGVSVDEARDRLGACNSPEVYELLVLQRGWTPQRYGRWLADTLVAALLPGCGTTPAAVVRPPRSGPVTASPA